MLCGIHVATCNTGFIGGSCWMLSSLTKDLKTELNTLNLIAIDKYGRLELYKKLSGYVQYHTMAKQFSSISMAKYFPYGWFNCNELLMLFQACLRFFEHVRIYHHVFVFMEYCNNRRLTVNDPNGNSRYIEICHITLFVTIVYTRFTYCASKIHYFYSRMPI